MATELNLIRHCNAVLVNGDYLRAPLTPLGRQQAAQTDLYFTALENHLDGFYASPLRRTQETAHIIGEKIGQTTEVRSGVQEMQLDELPALDVLEILSILDPVVDYLDAYAGKPILWPIEGRVSVELLDIVARHPDQLIMIIQPATKTVEIAKVAHPVEKALVFDKAADKNGQ